MQYRQFSLCSVLCGGSYKQCLVEYRRPGNSYVFNSVRFSSDTVILTKKRNYFYWIYNKIMKTTNCHKFFRYLVKIIQCNSGTLRCTMCTADTTVHCKLEQLLDILYLQHISKFRQIPTGRFKSAVRHETQLCQI